MIASASQIADAIDLDRKHPISIGKLRPSGLDAVPRWLERVVLRTLVLDRMDRPTMDKLRQDLAEAIARLKRNPENRLPSDGCEETNAYSAQGAAGSAAQCPREASAAEDVPTKELSLSQRDRSTVEIRPREAKTTVTRLGRRSRKVTFGVLGFGFVVLLLWIGIATRKALRRNMNGSVTTDRHSQSIGDLRGAAR